MSLITQARADIRSILTDNINGAGQEVILTAPDGQQVMGVVGFYTHIGLTIDPQSGMAVPGQEAHISFSMDDLDERLPEGLGHPTGVPETSRKPWIVTTNPESSDSIQFAVRNTMPDKTLRVLKCRLEIVSGVD